MAYVYRHIRLDKNEPFYIGIGSDSSFKRAFSRVGRNKVWKGVTKKTLYEIEILFEDLTWEQACEKEREFIALYGRRDLETGTLVNMTDGGDGGDTSLYVDYTTRDISGIRNGMYGKTHKKESIQKMVESKRGKSKSWNKGLTKHTSSSLEEIARKLSKFRTGKTFRPQSEETILKKSLALKGKPQPKTTCTKCGKEGSVSNIKRWHSENCKNVS